MSDKIKHEYACGCVLIMDKETEEVLVRKPCKKCGGPKYYKDGKD